ncbi:MAG: thioesterase family protein, partial [Acidimicrobiales bacterium]|nr:thioesterase family protein [Acidimicrobiales bacterium]
MTEIGEGQFDHETAAEPIGGGLFAINVSDQWNIGDNPNGGYLTAMALQALRALGPHADPISVTTHYLRPGSGGQPGVVSAELHRGTTRQLERFGYSPGDDVYLQDSEMF